MMQQKKNSFCQAQTQVFLWLSLALSGSLWLSLALSGSLRLLLCDCDFYLSLELTLNLVWHHHHPPPINFS